MQTKGISGSWNPHKTFDARRMPFVTVPQQHPDDKRPPRTPPPSMSAAERGLVDALLDFGQQ